MTVAGAGERALEKFPAYRHGDVLRRCDVLGWEPTTPEDDTHSPWPQGASPFEMAWLATLQVLTARADALVDDSI
jgi:hypothetical protein